MANQKNKTGADKGKKKFNNKQKGKSWQKSENNFKQSEIYNSDKSEKKKTDPFAKQSWGGGTLLSPVPATMVSCGDFENSNIVTVAWTGIVNTHPPMTYISLRQSRFSYGLIKENMEFAINLVPSSLAEKADFCGIYTGKKVNKFEKCGFDKQKASKISCPLIAQCPLNLECKVREIIHLGTHDMFLSEIVAIDVNENLLDEKGKLCLEKANLCAFAHGEYFEIGKKIGKFGFSVKSKKK